MRSPAPSLPVAGTDRPPVASITRLATMCSPDVRRTSQRSPSRASPLTRSPSRTIAPRRLTAASSASRTSFAWFEAGKSLPLSSSSRSGIPRSSSKKRRTLANGQARRIFARVWGEPSVMKSPGSACDGKTLHRPPPLIRIFLPGRSPPSSKSTGRAPPAAQSAAIRPAAPAPTITTGSVRKSLIRLREASGGTFTHRTTWCWPAPSPQSVTRTDYTTVTLLPANAMGSG